MIRGWNNKVAGGLVLIKLDKHQLTGSSLHKQRMTT